jgi:hypothetical protein
MNGLWDTLELKNDEVIDSLRARKGRDQAYGVSLFQPKLKYFKGITIPTLAICSKGGILWPYFHCCKELVSLSVLRREEKRWLTWDLVATGGAM